MEFFYQAIDILKILALVSMAGGGTGFPSGRRFSFYQIRLCTCNSGAFSSHTSGTGKAGAP